MTKTITQRDFGKSDDTMRVPCEVFSRIVGYIRPAKIGDTDMWNPGKNSEFHDRKTFNITSQQE